MRRPSPILWLLLVTCFGPLARGQGGASEKLELRNPADAAVGAIAAELQVERTLLAEAVERFRELSARRAALVERTNDLHADLERRLTSATEPGSLAGVEALLTQIDSAEADRRRLMETERALVEQILVQNRRVTLLEQQHAEFEGQIEEEEAGTMTGSWDVTVLPLEQKGRFDLRQSGTLVSGTYRLDGGWSGSLQGTLVSRKLYLIRIDSKLGKSMELEGFLSQDGKTIRGTWLNYELAGAAGSTGQWTATKR